MFLVFAACWHWFPFPLNDLDEQPVSIVVTDRRGRVLLERVGTDGQFRIPVSLARMSPWLSKAAVAVEDERFESHSGIDVIAVSRAAWQNSVARDTVSGASTITMQVCKMIESRPRTWQTKIVEAFRALQLEQLKTKPQILEAYLNLIPCGGNLRGVEVAARAYFGKSAEQLSLGEAALLAGLPQSPNRFAPDRHPDAAQRRRETVLRRMHELGMITSAQRDDAQREPIACERRSHGESNSGTWRPSSHAAWMALAQCPNGCRTTIDRETQHEVETLVREHGPRLPARADAAVVVIDVATSQIVALVGSANEFDPIDGQVNGVTARRSPGSALKPFLYAAAFETKRLAPDSLLDDVPIERAGWSPENFDRTYRGSISAADALRQSLNIPAIVIAEGLGLPRCLGVIESVGIELPHDAESRGGLAVATGGLEVTLLDLTNAYATLARDGVRREPQLVMKETPRDSHSVPEDQFGSERLDGSTSGVRSLDPNVCRVVGEILSSRERCPSGWESIAADRRPWCMWKTGTSSGRRDAWAVGHNGRYAIGVWVGCFHGAGHREFVGREAAEPLLASLFASHALRSSQACAPSQSWNVEYPLPRPVEASGHFAIVSPRDAATFLAWNGSTVIHPRTTSVSQVVWFHNGQAISSSEASRLVVPRGMHELRAVDPSGNAASVRFTVK